MILELGRVIIMQVVTRECVAIYMWVRLRSSV